MTLQPLRAVAVASLFANNHGSMRSSAHVMLDTDDGVVLQRLIDLHPADAGPPLNKHSLFLSPSGQTLLGRVPVGAAGTDLPGNAAGDEERLVLVDVATGRQRPTSFTRRGRPEKLHYGLASNEQDLAVAATHATPEAGGRITVTVLRGPDLQVSAERIFDDAYMRFDPMDVQLQWSPDGTRLALWMNPTRESLEAVVVLDAATLETVIQVDDANLAGSMCWSPDSERLVVLAEMYQQRILHVADGRLEALPWLDGERGDPPRQPQILALLSGERVLVQRQRGSRLRLSRVDLSTGKGPVLADFTLAHNDVYLRMAVSREWENLPNRPHVRRRA